MVVKYSQTMSLAQAMKQTFSGEMCGVCEVVNDAKRQESNKAIPQAGKMDGKLMLAIMPATEIFVGPVQPEVWSPSDSPMFSLGRSAPPLPPPRA